MADENEFPKDDSTEPPEVSVGGEPANDDAPQAAEPEAEIDPIVIMAAENSELKDHLLRALAETENLRKRAEKQVRDASLYAIANFARDALTVSDNLRRTIGALPEDARAKGGDNLKSLLDGVEMTEREMLKTLEKHGVKQVDPKGEKFDPNFHQAMYEVPDPSAVAGTVVDVVQPGYLIGERMLRPAMVGIAKGGPKAAEAPADAEPGDKIDRTA